MENGSKAIIIAGTVIVVMLFISLGMMYFMKLGIFSGNVKRKYSDDEINSFNDQFVSYELRQKGSRVKELINQVNISNQKNESQVIFTEGEELDSTISHFVVRDENGKFYPSSQLYNSKYYNVRFVRNNDNIITNIIIVEE